MIVLLLQSCSSHLSHRFDTKKYQSEPKAVIAIEMLYFEKGLFWNSHIPVEFTLAKVEPEYFSEKRKTYHVTKADIIMIEPGKYVIEDINYTSGNIITKSTLKGLMANGQIIYGAFSVQPGKLYDAGQIWVESNDHSLRLVQKKSGNTKTIDRLKKLDANFHNMPVEFLDMIPAQKRMESLTPEK